MGGRGEREQRGEKAGGHRVQTNKNIGHTKEKASKYTTKQLEA